LTPRLRPLTLNYMVKYSETALDRTFAALSDPTRRALLTRLSDNDGLSVSELARPFSMSLPAVMKHLDVLGDAGLVTRSKTGRTVACALKAAPMEDAMQWLTRYQRFWTSQLDRLAAFVEEDSCLPAQPPAPPSAQASRSNVVSMRRPKKSMPRGRNPRT
jgi:DNA-binding transcriptional ArsR family regulator